MAEITQQAECRHCGDPIERNPGMPYDRTLHPWVHTTGRGGPACRPLFASPKEAPRG